MHDQDVSQQPILIDGVTEIKQIKKSTFLSINASFDIMDSQNLQQINLVYVVSHEHSF